MYLPTSTIGTLGQCVLISGYHLLDTFSKELRALIEKQTRKQSVCKGEKGCISHIVIKHAGHGNTFKKLYDETRKISKINQKIIKFILVLDKFYVRINKKIYILRNCLLRLDTTVVEVVRNLLDQQYPIMSSHIVVHPRIWYRRSCRNCK